MSRSGASGDRARLDAYVARVPEGERGDFRAELEQIQRRYQHTMVQPDKAPLEVTIERRPGLEGEDQLVDPGTIDYSPHLPTERSPGDQDMTINATGEPQSARSGEQPLVPGYEIVGELGRGGMGVVYKARQRGLNRWVALKMVLAGAHAGPSQLARFQTEAEAVARLQHPNIVQIYDVGELDGLPYFSLEYIDGLSLDQKIHRQPQPPREAAHLIETLARAMDYAHENGIIHRDLKPANVLMTSDGKPKITDFGLAKRLEEDSSQTKSGTLMGTPSYMAPEQARGEIKEVGPLADVYSLGAMLYELLTGRPPFLASSAMDTIMQVTRDEAMAPTRIVPGTPRDIETICMKCLQKESDKRYPQRPGAGGGSGALSDWRADPGTANWQRRAVLALVQAQSEAGRSQCGDFIAVACRLRRLDVGRVHDSSRKRAGRAERKDRPGTESARGGEREKSQNKRTARGRSGDIGSEYLGPADQ